MKFIAGYTTDIKNSHILVERSFAGVTDSFYTKDFNALADWLTEYYPNTLHVVWDLSSFSRTIFSLLPQETRSELYTTTKAFYEDTKIFSVDRWLGLTQTKPLHGNFVERKENNFFGISHWMPSQTDEPKTTSEVAKYGEGILAGLERMGIEPNKLTSPVGVFTDELSQYDLPTIYSNQNIIDACEFCLPMMRKEWRSAFKLGFFPQVYSYDLISGYPYFISQLPDTDKCQIRYSNRFLKCDWAIMKGEIYVTSDISPFVYNTGDGYINPKGRWIDPFTSDEINWLYSHKAGKFLLSSGFFFTFTSNNQPYKEPINKVFSMRDKRDEMVNNLARRIGQGISGKLDQDNQDGSLGELYNPIYAAMTRSRCRLAVADFIYDNNLVDDVLSVQVDGCESLKEVPLEPKDGIGNWRLDSVTPALIAGKGEIWKPHKKPLNISYDEIMGAIKQRPKKSFYQVNGKYLDLLMSSTDMDREYDHFPRTGSDLTTKDYNSKALKVGEV